MKTLRHLIFTITLGGLLLYVTSRYIPESGLKIISEYNNDIVIFGFLGLMFWITNGVIKRILNIVTIPIKIITMGLSSIVLNVIMFYFFEQLINYMDVGIQVQLGTIIQVLVLSITITILYFLIKKIT